MVFKNRAEAGKLLAEKLEEYRNKETIIFGLPRGGVVIGAEIASQLNSPLEVIIARKIGHPAQPEFGIAAVTEDGHLIENEKYAATVDENWYRGEIERQTTAALHRQTLYSPALPEVSTEGKIAILTDDGIATGLTTKAALIDLRERKPKKLLLAVPVAPTEVASEISLLVDEEVIINKDSDFLGAVGAYYEEFPQITDEEVIDLLKRINSKIVKR
jgi:putative phosphoribosyl transferase